jgi:hypothetical protein
MTYLINRQPRAWQWLLFFVGLSVLATSCVPINVSRSEEAAYLGRGFEGNPETVAVIVGLGERPYTPALVDAVYNSVVQQLRRHPYFRPRFTIVERRQLDNLLVEQDLATRGVVDLATAPQVGRLLGARKFLYVELVRAEANFTGASLGGTPIGTVAATGYRSTVAVSMRLVDTETGQLEALGFATDESFIPESVVLNRVRAGVSEVDSAIIERLSSAVFSASNDLAIDYDLN